MAPFFLYKKMRYLFFDNRAPLCRVRAYLGTTCYKKKKEAVLSHITHTCMQAIQPPSVQRLDSSGKKRKRKKRVTHLQAIPPSS
jgi:hypothetical protein